MNYSESTKIFSEAMNIADEEKEKFRKNRNKTDEEYSEELRRRVEKLEKEKSK